MSCCGGGARAPGSARGRRSAVDQFQAILEYQVVEGTGEKPPREDTGRKVERKTRGVHSYYDKVPETLTYAPSLALRSAVLTFAFLQNSTTGDPYVSGGICWCSVFRGAPLTARSITARINEKARRVNGAGEDIVSQRTVEGHLKTLKEEGFIKVRKASNRSSGVKIDVWLADMSKVTQASSVSSVVDNQAEVSEKPQTFAVGTAKDCGPSGEEHERDYKNNREGEFVDKPGEGGAETPGSREGEPGDRYISAERWKELREAVRTKLSESMAVPREIEDRALEDRMRAPRYTWDLDPDLLERTGRQAEITEMAMEKWGR